MAAGEWAIHVVAYNGMDTFGFRTRKAAEDTRREILDQGGGVWVSSVIQMIPGEEHWVVHVRMQDGRMRSFGFKKRPEAMTFHKAVRKVEEGVDVISFPTKQELGASPKDWMPEPPRRKSSKG